MFKKISEKIALEIKKQLKDKKIQDFITQIKEVGDDRKFKVIASTGTVDRYNEIIVPEGIKKDNYMKNPVVLWAHSYKELPIGIADKVYVKDKKVIVEGRFAPADANPEAEKIKKLYDGGFLRAVSIGFTAKAWEDFKDDEGYKRKYTKWELLELSFVPVPANPEALDILKSMGKKLDIDISKIFIFKEKKEDEALKAVRDLAIVVKDITKEIKNIKNNQGQESKPTTDNNHGNNGKTDGGDERKIVLSGEFAQKLRQDIQSADKVLEQINIALKTAINKITQ